MCVCAALLECERVCGGKAGEEGLQSFAHFSKVSAGTCLWNWDGNIWRNRIEWGSDEGMGKGCSCKYARDGCSLAATVPRYLTGPRPAAAATETDNELNSGRKRQMQQNKCEAFSKTQHTICDMRCTATCDHICNRWVHVCGRKMKCDWNLNGGKDDAQLTECIAQSTNGEWKQSRNLETVLKPQK